MNKQITADTIRAAVSAAAETIKGCCLCQGDVKAKLASAVADQLVPGWRDALRGAVQAELETTFGSSIDHEGELARTVVQAVELDRAKRDDLRLQAEEAAESIGMPEPVWTDKDGRFQP